MSSFLQTTTTQLVGWLTRPRNVGLKLLTAGVVLLGMTLGADFLGQVDYQDGQRRFSFKVASGDSLPKALVLTAYGIAVLLIATGLALVLYSFIAETRQNARKRAIVVEIRGLHSSPDTPAREADLGNFPRIRQDLKLDFRPAKEGDFIDPELALRKISGMKDSIRALTDGRDPADISIAVGGLAAVPALFLAGVLLDDESAFTIYDWHRDTMKWLPIDGPDDGKRFIPLDLAPLDAAAEEVVLAVSLSYSVNLGAAKEAFPKLPVLELKSESLVTNSFWSEEKQQALASEFREVAKVLDQRGVKRIHLLLAAPASLAIRFGKAYDRRLLPDLLVYQYEKNQTPAYPWAFAMPTKGKPEAKVVVNRPLDPGRTTNH